MTIAQAPDLLYPLTVFRKRDHRPLPVYEAVDAEAVPEPYRTLLVHKGDMTSRLEAHHGSPLKLRVLHRSHTPEVYLREVLLCTANDELPVEYGAIEIDLATFAEPLRSQIVEGRLPLGGLLNSHGFKYRSRPRGFLRVLPDLTLCRHFGVEAASAFWGRSNVLLGADDRVFAQIVEVLRP
jgi:chorismate-pyruvate lyase